MCTCTSCEYTDSFHDKGFEAWPKGDPAGERASNRVYAAHVAHVWSGSYKTIAFTPGQAPAAPRLPGLVMPVTYHATAIRWNTGRGKMYVPAPEPVRVPTLLDLARKLRAEARAERQALRQIRKAA